METIQEYKGIVSIHDCFEDKIMIAHNNKNAICVMNWEIVTYLPYLNGVIELDYHNYIMNQQSKSQNNSDILLSSY